jgi:hypothetical protein
MDRVHIQSVEALPGYRLRLGLSDGRTVEREFAAELAGPTGPMNEPLKDPLFFAQVRVDPELQTVVWPNGYDMDPDVLIWGLNPDGTRYAVDDAGRELTQEPSMLTIR